MLRRGLVVLLCLATLFNGVAAAATSFTAAASSPCETSSDHDSGNAPCGDCGDSGSACLQQCAALCAGVLVAGPVLLLTLNIPSQRVAVDAATLFDSLAGPPGYQPPR